MSDREELLKLAAFTCDGLTGGNPAGVAISDELPPPTDMQKTAFDVGYSETVFAAPVEDGWRVRYFSPTAEVPFCGHATIALGAALAQKFGSAEYRLFLNHIEITVEGRADGNQLLASLTSAPTHHSAPSRTQLSEALSLFGYNKADLSHEIPPAVIYGGSNHLALTLNSREALAAMKYDFDSGRELMLRQGWVTVMLAHPSAADRFHSRNAFAYGGVYEDCATGSATAAYAGYIRDLRELTSATLRFFQGDDMAAPSRLTVVLDPSLGKSVRVAGQVRIID
jgi:PhzF family phenazine biosynthesis protein